ncbi:cyclic GMP-AMP synthase-like receptor [Argopecten irradians]|uniref:cyclic GMP-AMP synthase-like receptor n=1 Tax=Argopecten irradians TaxID=31199 RepID=UPI00371A9956
MLTISRRLTLINDLLYNASAVLQVQLSTGSSAEGILMKGSDKDSMLIDKMVIILDFDQESLSITSDLRNESVFIMRDSNDRPGYVNLELINMRQQPPAMLLESIVPFGNSHFLSSALYTRCAAFILSTVFQVPIETHGPSTPLLNEKSKVGSDMDIVCAFSCSSWPVVAHEWVTRSRMYNWPVASLRDQIVNGGCYVVPFGDKTSECAFMQWRISFASAERKLIHSFSHVQFLVYCLLKYLFKQVSDRLKDIYGDEDIISSYILKTVVFHALETTPTSLWQEKNTFLCFMLCLKMLSAYVKAGHCPNYFIYKHNMFLGKVCGKPSTKTVSFSW